jgi:hypothetical protein
MSTKTICLGVNRFGLAAMRDWGLESALVDLVLALKVDPLKTATLQMYQQTLTIGPLEGQHGPAAMALRVHPTVTLAQVPKLADLALPKALLPPDARIQMQSRAIM